MIALDLALAFVASVSISGQVPVGSLEVTIRLTTPGLSPAVLTAVRPAAHRLAVRGRRLVAEVPGIERNPELAEDRIVVAACDKDGREIARVSLADPRLLRAEVADEEGRLSIRLLYRPEAEFTIAFPADPAIAVLRVCHPVWDGQSFELALLGEVRLVEGGR